MPAERAFKTKEDLISSFIFWAASLTHLTNAQLLDGFTKTYRLTHEEVGEVRKYLQEKPPPPKPPPPPPKPTAPPEKPPPKPPVKVTIPTRRPEEAPTPPVQPPEEKPAPAPAAPKQPLPKVPTVKPELIVERTPYPKWWKEEGTAPISLAGPGSQIVISARSDYSLYIGAIVLTVTDETDITFTFGVFGPSGAMSFGGSDEPRGIVIAMGNSPAPCGSGSFAVTSAGAAAAVQGFVTYFLSKK